MEVPAQIKLRVGETYTLKLPGLGAAGYIWIPKIIENCDLIEVSEINQPRTDQSSDQKNPLSVGSVIDQIFSVKAQKSGHTSICFIQNRSWEKNNPPLKRHILEIEIHH